MIYVDTSVVLAEGRHPSPSFWESSPIVSSRLLEYEAWTRVNGRGLEASLGDELRALLGRLAFLELAPPVLARALEPFLTTVRTLDALHLASIEFLRAVGQRPTLATCDLRLGEAASALAIPLADLDSEGTAG